jgi:hypothetical protein
LEDKFKQLKAEQNRLLQEGEENRLKKLRNIREYLGLLSTKNDLGAQYFGCFTIFFGHFEDKSTNGELDTTWARSYEITRCGEYYMHGFVDEFPWD